MARKKRRMTEAQEFEIMKLVLDKFLWLGFALMGVGLFKAMWGLSPLYWLIIGAAVLVIYLILLIKEYEIVKRR